MRGTNEEYLTGQLIGDFGLILKDVGGPSVIGMMALEEIMSIFKEGIAGGGRESFQYSTGTYLWLQCCIYESSYVL